MPYANPDEWRAAHARRYVEIYRADKKFRRTEAERKADWYALRASDPAWLAAQAEKKRLQRAAKKKIIKKKSGKA